MNNTSPNLHTDIKESVYQHFSFLKKYGFADFKEHQLAYEMHFKATNEIVTIDIWYEATYSTPIWITIDGYYIENLALHNEAVKQYHKDFSNTYDALFKSYLEHNDHKYLKDIAERYAISGKTINDRYLAAISSIILENAEILNGDVTTLKKATAQTLAENQEKKRAYNVSNGIYTLEYDLWQGNSDYSFFEEFTTIPAIELYLKSNPEIKKYRVLDAYGTVVIEQPNDRD